MSFSLAEVERALAVVRLRPEGATLAARVRPALAALGALIGPASQGSLSCSAVRRGRRGWSVSGPTVYTLWNMDEGLFEEYLAIYAAHDPSVPLFVQRPGQEVVASSLFDAVKEAADNALVRLFPKFDDADHVGWSKVIDRARKGSEAALEAVDYQGQIARYFVRVGDAQFQAMNMIDGRPFEAGTGVQVAFNPQDCSVLPIES